METKNSEWNDRILNHSGSNRCPHCGGEMLGLTYYPWRLRELMESEGLLTWATTAQGANWKKKCLQCGWEEEESATLHLHGAPEMVIIQGDHSSPQLPQGEYIEYPGEKFEIPWGQEEEWEEEKSEEEEEEEEEITCPKCGGTAKVVSARYWVLQERTEGVLYWGAVAEGAILHVECEKCRLSWWTDRSHIYSLFEAMSNPSAVVEGGGEIE